MNIDDINNELDILSREYSAPPQQQPPQQQFQNSASGSGEDAEQVKKRELDEQIQRNKMHNNYVFNTYINPQFDNNGFKKNQDGRMLAVPSRSGEDLINYTNSGMDILNPDMVNNVGVNANMRVPSMMHSQFENSYEFTPQNTIHNMPVQQQQNIRQNPSNNLQMERNLQIRNMYDAPSGEEQLTEREIKWLMINDLQIEESQKERELYKKLELARSKLSQEQFTQAVKYIKSQRKNYTQEQISNEQINQLMQKKKRIDIRNSQKKQANQQPFSNINQNNNQNNNMLDMQFNSHHQMQNNNSNSINGGNNANNGGNNANEGTKKDIRHSINSQIGSFIFDNVNNINPPMIPRSIDPFEINTRVNMQEKSKNLYKNESNERLSMLNPIGRAMSFPVNYDSSRPANYL